MQVVWVRFLVGKLSSNIPHALWPKNQNKKQKQYYNNVVTIQKTLKMVHIKKKKKKEKLKKKWEERWDGRAWHSNAFWTVLSWGLE